MAKLFVSEREIEAERNLLVHSDGLSELQKQLLSQQKQQQFDSDGSYKSLYEQLQENKEQQEDQYNARLKPQPPKALDEDEFRFLQEREEEHRRLLQQRESDVRKELVHFYEEKANITIPAVEDAVTTKQPPLGSVSNIGLELSLTKKKKERILPDSLFTLQVIPLKSKPKKQKRQPDQSEDPSATQTDQKQHPTSGESQTNPSDNRPKKKLETNHEKQISKKKETKNREQQRNHTWISCSRRRK